MNVDKMIILLGVFSGIYILTEVFLPTYLQHLRERTFIPYDYYYHNIIRPIGLLVLFLFVLLLQHKNKPSLYLYCNSARALMYIGILIFFIYYSIVILYWYTDIKMSFFAIIIKISLNYSLLLCIPAALLAIGIASYFPKSQD